MKKLSIKFISGYKSILRFIIMCPGYSLLFAFIWIFSTGFSQSGNETGLLPIHNFSSATYNAQEQNFAIAEDNRGLMYFANNDGVLEYDGKNWRLIELGNKRARSLCTDKFGRVYVGSENDLGYLAPDSIGKLRFYSLLSFIPEEYSEFQVVWNVFTRNETVFFQTDYAVFIWDGMKMKVIPTNRKKIVAMFKVEDDFYAKIEGKGLTILNDSSFNLVPKGEYFSNKTVLGILRIDSTTLLIGSERFSFFKLTGSFENLDDWSLTKIHTQADNFLSKYEFYNALLINDEIISIGTWGGGLILMNLKGEIKTVFDKSYGLQDQIIQWQYLDSKGNIWLALSQGISRVEVQSPISFFNNQNGLQGTVQSITRFNQHIYAATNLGVSYSRFQPAGINGDKGIESVFKPVDKLFIECWDLLTFRYKNEEHLLVVTNAGISMISESNQITPVMEGIVYDIYQSALDPARVYVGLEDGLTSIYYSNGKWIEEKKIRGIEETISNITEDFLGNLWMGTFNQGVLKLNIKSFKNNRIDSVEVFKFDSLHGIPQGNTVVSQVSQKIMIGTTKGIYRFRSLQGMFEPDSSFGSEFADSSHYIHRISSVNENKIWLATVVENNKNKYQIGCLKPESDNEYKWEYKPFTRISESIQHAIYHDVNGVVWIGGPNGLFRYDPSIQKNYKSDYYTLIRSVVLSNGDTIFAGTGYNDSGYASILQPPALVPELPYSLNSMTYDFAAQSGEDEKWLNFSYMLEGYDRKWSEYASQNKKEYTNLSEGSYIMRVKSRNIYGHEGVEATFSFTILSPWYRTIAAYIGYAVFLAFFIFGIVKVYTRNLREIIRERTAEVVRQKDEIEEKNKEITDSIHYASRIQSAILPPSDSLDNTISDFFILYMPRDIVSGDFYWINSDKKKLVTVAADCTGHGVPGAFMSMLGVAFLNEIVRKHDQITADEILNQLRAAIIKSLRQTGKEGENKDGMDIALCIYDLEKMKLQFSGANNPLLLIRNEEMIVYKADKMPIGIHARADEPFTLYEMDILPGDIFYSFSDGYVDQFGGPEGKKFLSKQFKEYLLEIHKEDLKKQEQLLKNKITDWMSKVWQVDDILVMGIKI